MSKSEPTVQKYMTYQPQSIEADQSIEKAQSVMSAEKIRHLPVTEDGKLIGIISDRDIKMAEGLVDVDPKLLLVKDICHDHPYEVSPETKLHEVAMEMASRKLGSALVVQNDKLVGIFTTVDACEALAEILQQRFHTHL